MTKQLVVTALILVVAAIATIILLVRFLPKVDGYQPACNSQEGIDEKKFRALEHKETYFYQRCVGDL